MGQATFSTSDVHARHRTAYWQAVASKAFLTLDCRAADARRFSAELTTSALAGLRFVTVRSDACLVSRGPREIASSEDDDLLLSVQMQGTTMLSQESAPRRRRDVVGAIPPGAPAGSMPPDARRSGARASQHHVDRQQLGLRRCVALQPRVSPAVPVLAARAQGGLGTKVAPGRTRPSGARARILRA